MIGDELEARVKEFANSAVSLAMSIPIGARGGAHISDQLLRAATRARAAYAEARGSESPRDFIHKMGIALKELRESETWLDSARAANLVDEQAVLALIDEVDQLIRIFFASRRTAKNNLKAS